MSNIDISITTSDGESYKVTLNPATGNGVLHPVEDFCDKVRIKDFELDNEDGIFYIDYYLEKEWDDLLEAALAERADAWLKTESVQAKVDILREIKDQVIRFDRENRRKRLNMVNNHTKILKELHAEATVHGGFDSLTVKRHHCCHTTEHMAIIKDDFELVEID